MGKKDHFWNEKEGVHLCWLWSLWNHGCDWGATPPPPSLYSSGGWPNIPNFNFFTLDPHPPPINFQFRKGGGPIITFLWIIPLIWACSTQTENRGSSTIKQVPKAGAGAVQRHWHWVQEMLMHLTSLKNYNCQFCDTWDIDLVEHKWPRDTPVMDFSFSFSWISKMGAFCLLLLLLLVDPPISGSSLGDSNWSWSLFSKFWSELLCIKRVEKDHLPFATFGSNPKSVTDRWTDRLEHVLYNSTMTQSKSGLQYSFSEEQMEQQYNTYRPSGRLTSPQARINDRYDSGKHKSSKRCFFIFVVIWG